MHHPPGHGSIHLPCPCPAPSTRNLLSFPVSLLATDINGDENVAMTAQHNGIGILCDAAGSDLLLASVPSPPVPEQQQHQEQQQQPARKVKRSKKSAASTTSHTSVTNQYTCHVCKRVYERADHLTRHLKSHENARPYECTRCPKRFNRA